jgi:hypothetical protein
MNPEKNGKKPGPGIPELIIPYLMAPPQNTIPIPIQNKPLIKSLFFIIFDFLTKCINVL